MEDHDRMLFLSSRDHRPANEAVVFMETHVALPDQPLPIFDERSQRFCSLDEALKKKEERFSILSKIML